MTTVALLGYGRFGSAFGDLLSDAGIGHRAFDTGGAVPAAHRASSLRDLVEGVQFVVIAVPVAAIGAALLEVAPLLAPEQVVFDVASVKVRPEAALREVLGERVPWVATHPLFGPTSLKLAQRPLRVVVCRSPLHPGAEQAVRGLYRRLGCEVIEQSAEQHDRTMARTHALTFFVAKGMMDVGVDQGIPFAPPSFAAIARMIEAVRSDAGHLFAALQNENPYSAEVRHDFIQALRSIDQALSQAAAAGPGPEREAAEIAIPDLGRRSPELAETRELIDALDRELVALLSRRAELARRPARAKAELGQPVLDAAREAALLEDRRRWAEELAMDAEGVAEVFRAIVRFSRSVQG